MDLSKIKKNEIRWRIVFFASIALPFFSMFLLPEELEGFKTFLVFAGLVTLLISGIVTYFGISSSLQKATLALMDKTFKNVDFIADEKYLGNNFNTAIGLNEKERKVILLNKKDVYDSKFSHRIISFKEIIEVKIKCNSKTLTRTSRGSQVAGAAVGGVLAGGIGAVIGGLSGSSTSEDVIKDLRLEIVINDLRNPTFEIPFFISSTGIKGDDEMYQDIEKEINFWYRMLSVAIHQSKN